MALSYVEEKILGRLGRQTAASNPLLSASLFQVLGLSILLSRKLVKARKVRRLDITRDTKSLQLYHRIIWLAREGLSITEVYILPYCQDGEQGPECRVMAAKLRASLYHVFCLFHNNPPISAVSPRSPESVPPGSPRPRDNGPALQSPGRSPRTGKEKTGVARRLDKAPLRDPIPSMTSDTSYVTNPYAGPAQSSPPVRPPTSAPVEARQTPSRPPGLKPINVSSPQAAAAFLLPPLNFVPMAAEHFSTTQHLAESLLPPSHGLRLSVSLEHAAFIWDCQKDHNRARHLAKKTIKEVYTSSEGLDDDEFADASGMVRSLGGIVKRGTNEAARRSSREQLTQSPQRSSSRPTIARAQPPHHNHTQRGPDRGSPMQRARASTTRPHIDRTISVSPLDKRGRTPSIISERGSITHTPDRLSTVPEIESGDVSEAPTQPSAISPPASRLSSRSGIPRRTSSATSDDKTSKRKAVEAAEEIYRRTTKSGDSGGGGGGGRTGTPRQTTPQGQGQGYVRLPAPR